jgi:hypothetical protein
MLRHVALVRIDVTEELSASIIRVTRIGELGTMLAVTSNRRMLRSCEEPHGVTSQKTAFLIDLVRDRACMGIRIGWGGMNLIDLVQDRAHVDMVINCQLP